MFIIWIYNLPTQRNAAGKNCTVPQKIDFRNTSVVERNKQKIPKQAAHVNQIFGCAKFVIHIMLRRK